MTRFACLTLLVIAGYLAAGLVTAAPGRTAMLYDLADDAAGAKVGGTIAPDGRTEIQCDLPASQQLHNVGGSDGSGLCVFTSIGHSARWQHIKVLEDFRDWMRKYPGGGFPSKVSAKIKQICAERGVPEPSYLQVEGKDIEILKRACRSGRMPGVTYSFSPSGRYNGQRIAHMTNLVHLDDKYGCILDNNFICTPEHPNNYEWLSIEEFTRSYTAGGSGWAVILLAPSPPPPPRPWN
jgi:hypothetical protein